MREGYLTVASKTKKLDSGILKALKLVSSPSLDLENEKQI
jgi:hypothetical protein